MKFNSSPIAAHFNEEKYSFENIVLCCIEANHTWTDEQRKMRETYLINVIDIALPST